MPDSNSTIISIEDLQRSSGLENESIILEVNEMSTLDIKTLVYLKKKYNLEKIKIESEEYDVDTYAKMRRSLDKIVDGIDYKASDLDKFTRIYERIARRIRYDREEESFVKSGGAEGRKNYEAHMLKGGLVDGLAVCEGYAKILNHALKCVGVESNIIFAREKQNPRIGHVWNQVQIDGIWYNTDVTYDEGLLKEGTTPEYCLQSDKEFLHNDYSISGYVYEVSFSFDQEVVSKHFDRRRFRIDNDEKIEYTSQEVDELIEEITDKKNYVSDEIMVEIKNIIPSARAGIMISNIVDDRQIKYMQKSGILLDYGQLSKFLKEHLDNKDLIKNEKTQEATTIYRRDGINLKFDKKMREELKLIGIDIDEIIKPKSKLDANRALSYIDFLKSKNKNIDMEINDSKDNYEIRFSKNDEICEISEDELINFFQKIGEKYTDIRQTTIGKKQIKLSSNDDINIILSKNVKDNMLETGCDFSTTLEKPENALAIKKESFWKKFIEKFRNRASKNIDVPKQTIMPKPKATMDLKDWIRVGELQPLSSQRSSKEEAKEDKELGE